MRKRLWLFAPILIGGCQMDTLTCGDIPAVIGTWRYTGVEQSPMHATMIGTLSISSVSCSAIVGELDVQQTDALGTTQRRAGPVTGQVIDAVSFRLDAFLETTPRQHIVALRGDSLSGSWVSVDGTQAVTGTFSARHQ